MNGLPISPVGPVTATVSLAADEDLAFAAAGFEVLAFAGPRPLPLGVMRPPSCVCPAAVKQSHRDPVATRRFRPSLLHRIAGSG